MNNLPLQPLVWGVDEYTGEPASNSLLHGYIVMNDGNGKFKVAYYLLSGGTYTKFATGFATINEAKAWAWNHYNEKMQPYVKPLPTWIDASERLPEDKEKYLVLTECGKVWTGHYGLVSKNPNEWWLHGYTVKRGWHPYRIVGWMPIPEFSTMQNLHKRVIVSELDGWISVKDKLPTHHQEVIVYRHDGEKANIEYSLYFNAPYFNDDGMIGFGDVKNGGDFLTDVYYWQPIETKALYEAMAMQLQIKGERL